MTEKELLAARQSIVQKLTQARLEKGLSQEQLAKRIGTQRSNICRIEKGTQNLSLDLMLKIAEALDKDVSVMLEERSSTMEKVYSLRLYDETLLPRAKSSIRCLPATQTLLSLIRSESIHPLCGRWAARSSTSLPLLPPTSMQWI